MSAIIQKLSFLFATILIIATSTGTLKAQVELTPMAGYSLADKFDTYNGSAKISDNFLWGINLAFNMGYGKQIELSYERQDGNIAGQVWRPELGGYTQESIDVVMDYILAGFVYNREIPGSVAVPFGGLSLGTAIATGQNNGYEGNSLWLFDVQVKLGVKIFPSDKIGIRLQTQLHMPMQGSGGGLSCGVGTGGSGCGVSMGGYTTITQLGFSGGLIFRLGGDATGTTTGQSSKKSKKNDKDLMWGSLSSNETSY
jgi:hypothetical protein